MVRLCSTSTIFHTIKRGISQISTAEALQRRNDSAAATVIVGGSRGIGFALVKQALERMTGPVVLASRSAKMSGVNPALTELLTNHSDRLHVVEMDITDEDSISNITKELYQMFPGGIDVLVNTVGILHSGSSVPERSIVAVEKEWMMKNFLVNACGHALVAKHFTPLLSARSKTTKRTSVMASLSARVGSISDNHLGGWYSYRASKAAQNQLMRTISLEVKRKGVTVISLHPGTVATDLSLPFQRNVKPDKLFTTDFSASCLYDILECVEKDDTGKFYAWDKEEILY